jgi:hypothetical protein
LTNLEKRKAGSFQEPKIARYVSGSMTAKLNPSKRLSALQCSKDITKIFAVCTLLQRRELSLWVQVKTTQSKCGTSRILSQSTMELGKSRLWSKPNWQSWLIRSLLMLPSIRQMINSLHLPVKIARLKSGVLRTYSCSWSLRDIEKMFGIFSSRLLINNWFR